MKILVCGGRDFTDIEFLYTWLNSFAAEQNDKRDRIKILIHGDARGADRLAHGWAVLSRVQPVRCPALWDDEPQGWGTRAGAVRNEAMLLLAPDVVIAFPGGDGTAHMVRIATRAHIKVIEPKG
jgi:hypothetical protein